MSKHGKSTVKKMSLIIAAIMLVVGITIGGTVAWLVSSTGTVTNAFTVGNIQIKLDEAQTNVFGVPYKADGETLQTGTYDLSLCRASSGNIYKLLPGGEYVKDPTITVLANSEACYLFVVVDEPDWEITVGTDSKTFKDYVSYTLAFDLSGTPWSKLVGYKNVYYTVVAATTADVKFELISGNKISCDGESVTSEMINAWNNDSSISKEIKFAAGAVQQANIASASDAFEKLPSSLKSLATKTTN